VLVAPIPVFDFDPPALLGIRNEWQQSTLDIGFPTQLYRAQNAQVFQFLSHLNASERDLVLPQRVLCDAEFCRSYSAEHGVLYFNSNHLSLMGAKVLVDAMHL
jgi:hypothetical protein